MKYYVRSIEQIVTDGALSEYSTDKKKNTEDEAYTEYYNTLRNVSNDHYTEDTSEKQHTYMRISLEESTGRVIKCDSLWQYLEALPTPEPETQD